MVRKASKYIKESQFTKRDEQGKQRAITLKKESPWVVEKLLQYLYSGSYDLSSSSNAQLFGNLDMYAAGKEYLVDGLSELAANRFVASLYTVGQISIRTFKMMVDMVYTHGPKERFLVENLIRFAHRT